MWTQEKSKQLAELNQEREQLISRVEQVVSDHFNFEGVAFFTGDVFGLIERLQELVKPEPDAEAGWIKHDGGECPVVELGQKVFLRFKGSPEDTCGPVCPDHFDWEITGPDFSIIAYRLA